jgi:triacylglycerol lipase
MRFIKTMLRAVKCFFLSLFFNTVLLFALPNFHPVLKVFTTIALLVFYVRFILKPYSQVKRPQLRNVRTEDSQALRMRILIGGRECILITAACFVLELVLYVAILFFGLIPSAANVHPIVLIINAIVCVILMGIVAISGVIRIFAASKQAGLFSKVFFALLWWVPILNIVLLKKLCDSAGKEYVFITKKADLNESRKLEQVCKTKYPLLMVHGIFFRDWKFANYWGRIPNELEANGATCFYGNQESSASVAECGAELAKQIQNIITETGCEKLNIIAHSKGGLDSRYAISSLGMGKYIASLTTICTPHYGCKSIRKIVKRIPDKAIRYIDKNYETLFTILGDKHPDLLNGLEGVMDTSDLNESMPDDPSVYYQSVGSKMKSQKSAVFPLSLGYSIIEPAEGDNDGLVAVDSMEWGNFLGVVSPSGNQGISHADMIDLTRKDIEGFDICEFYVDLVSKLKERGL